MKKRWIELLTVLVLAAGIMICPFGENAYAESDSDSADPFTPDDCIIFEKEGVKITTAGLDKDPTDGDDQPIIWLEIENTGKEDAFLGVSNGSVNGFMTDVLLVTFYEENGAYFGADYDFSLTVPAESRGQYALSYYKVKAPGVDTDTLGELEFCFTLAEDEYTWPDYTSEPVKIVTNLDPKPADISSLGTAVMDNDQILLVFGEQDYDDWFGPEIAVYAENRTNKYIGIAAETATADGHDCDYIYYGNGIAPGKRSAVYMSFNGEIRELKGIEDLTVTFSMKAGADPEKLSSQKSVLLDPISVQYPPQEWGEYENDGLSLEIMPKYHKLVTVETPANDDKGILFTVSETASVEAGKHDGAGWLFSIGKVSEDRLHEMMCQDMSGARVFAKDSDRTYYMYYHPTDVRFERATQEELEDGLEQWSMLCEWANEMPDSFSEKNSLETVSYGNSEVDILIARAAYMDEVEATLSTTEYGPISASLADGAPYAEFVMGGWFTYADEAEVPDGEYVVLNFEKDNARLDFFYAPGGLVRLVSGNRSTLYQAMWYDDNMSFAEVMQGWYYAALEKAGVKPADESLSPFRGEWHEKTAGRGIVTVSDSLAPMKVKIDVTWPDSASLMSTWKMTAALDRDGKLIYENGIRTVTEYGEDGENWITDESWEESGWFYLNDDGELCWHDDHAEKDEDSVFVR